MKNYAFFRLIYKYRHKSLKMQAIRKAQPQGENAGAENRKANKPRKNAQFKPK